MVYINLNLKLPQNLQNNEKLERSWRGVSTVEPLYNEVLGTMKITLLYQVSHYIRVKKQRNTKSWDQQNYLVIIGFCYIRPRYNEVPLYWTLCNVSLNIVFVTTYCSVLIQWNNIQWTANAIELYDNNSLLKVF